MSHRAEDAATGTTSRRGTIGWILRAVEVRFRFVLLLAALLLVFGGWSFLQSRVDWLLRKVRGGVDHEAAISSDTEYFCPMDPGVLSDWPEKCPICQMALVRRKKGDAEVLPSGVTARMQLTPERVQLAGVRTVTVEYQPVHRELTVGGVISRDGDASWALESAIARADIPVAAEAAAGDCSFHVDGVSETSAKLVAFELVAAEQSGPPRVRVSIDDADHQLHAGQYVTVTMRVSAAAFEPFRSLSIDPPPLREGELRTVYACPNHADTLHDAAGKCPLDQQPLVARKLAVNERVTWWCPMHAEVTSSEPGHECSQCNGMRLVPRVVSYAPAGTVLAVPESAVVDFGAEQIVYVERMPGMYDGVRVELGASCGGQYPVLRGLTPGDRVVAVGAFLLDAETRLNPALANSYFGAGPNAAAAAGTPASASTSNNASADERIKAALDQLSRDDRAAAERQGTCPVTGLRLGSMGAPIKVVSGDKELFVCCQGCIGQLDPPQATNQTK